MLDGTAPVMVTVRSRNEGAGGQVVFQEHKGVRPTSSSFDPTDSLNLRVASNEGWTPFWIAGSIASENLKDVEIVVARADNGSEVAALSVMVRVRKDASALNEGEVRRLLSALRKHHDLDDGRLSSKYIKYADAHRRAFSVGIHGGTAPRYWPLFLAWHRAFLLSIERELQAIDRSVTLPYWRFDRDDPSMPTGNEVSVFSPQFMGTVSRNVDHGGAFIVEFSPQNPLHGWTTANGPLVRISDGSSAPIASVDPGGDPLHALFTAQSGSGKPINNTYYHVNGGIELQYHNRAHSYIGGWLMRSYSPEDPLFYLLHANVDRAWAQWQQLEPAVRFDPSNRDAYHAQGQYPGLGDMNGRFRKGSYANDEMWPWAADSGNPQDGDELDDWPDLRFDMPIGPSVGGSSSRPTPGDMIDYLDKRGVGGAIGVCYDSIGFQ